jgi:Fic family protein
MIGTGGKKGGNMYHLAHQFEPLLPAQGRARDALLGRARRVVDAARALSCPAHPATRAALRALLRSMNSYYSNRIEGQSTHPLNIERALRRDFSDQPAVARLQRVALAHIDAEQELEAMVQAGTNALSADFLLTAHAALYRRLTPADRRTDDGETVAPGQLRTKDVLVSRHLAPRHETLPLFLAAYSRAYATTPQRDTAMALLGIACAHQRATWIHPFIDGNGRAARLQTHAALSPLSHGLWSPSRGMARQVADYYARLAIADAPRRGDLDGRANLTEAGLIEWCDYFFELCLDQVTFMGRMLELDGMRTRIGALITFRAATDKALRPEAVLPLYHLFAAGPLARGEFARMTGLGERTARTLLSRLLATGLVASDGPYSAVRFAFPLDALQFLLPELYPEAATRLP